MLMRDLLAPTALFVLLAASCTAAFEGLEGLGGDNNNNGGGGGGDPNDPDGGPRPGRDGSIDSISLADYCERAYQLEIEKAQTCYTFDPRYSERMLDALRFKEECEWSTTDHRYHFDPLNAAACLEHRATQECAEYYFPWHFDQVTSCARTLLGTGREGESCSKLDECAQGLICDVRPPLGACTFRCVPDHGNKRSGESCSTIHDCLEGLICPDAVVPNRACYPRPERGDDCVPGSPLTCGRGFACSLTTQTCQPLRNEGERCQYTEDCAPMLVCGGLQGEERCQLGGRVADECLEGQATCYPEAYCSDQNWCLPRGLTGDSCTPNGAIRCAEGWFCDPYSTSCQLPRGDGERCSDHSHCTSGLCEAGFCRNACD
jgi:hypothetical protein